MRRVTVIINASRSAAAAVSAENNSLFHCLIYFFFVLPKYPTRRFRHRNRLNAIDGLVNSRYHDDDDYYDGHDDDDNNNNCWPPR